MSDYRNDRARDLSAQTYVGAKAAPSPFDTLVCIDEAAIGLLDSLTPTHSPNAGLIQSMPARDLNAATAALVKALQDINVERINRPFSWWERMSGKDIELRIRFDLATHEIAGLMNDVVTANRHAETARDVIAKDARDLAEVNALLPVLINAAHECHAQLSGEQFHLQRFAKRIADLETLLAANQMLEAQYLLAHQTLIALLDRTGEVSRLLLPMWQQHAFAIANAGIEDETEQRALNGFSAIQKKIFARLSAGKEIAT